MHEPESIAYEEKYFIIKKEGFNRRIANTLYMQVNLDLNTSYNLFNYIATINVQNLDNNSRIGITHEKEFWWWSFYEISPAIALRVLEIINERDQLPVITNPLNEIFQ